MVTPVQSQRYAAQVKDFTEAEHRAYYQFLLSGGKAEDFFLNIRKHLAGQHDQDELDAIAKAAESYTPTKGMKTAAERALRWKKEGKAKGAGTPVGWGRATDIAAGRAMSLDIVKRMYSFFSRHEVDKQGKDFDNTSNPSNGRIMWDAWGGDAGFTWSKAIVERAKKLEKHLAGKHNQASHAGGKGKSNAAPIGSLVGKSATTPVNLSAKETEALSAYVNTWMHAEVNSYLRDGEKWLAPHELERAKAMDKDLSEAISRSELLQDTELVRAIPFPSFGEGEGFIGNLDTMKGKTFIDKGFMSTTKSQYDNEAFTGGVKVNIFAPKGTKALDVTQVFNTRMSDFDQEVLLQKGLKYKVTNVTSLLETNLPYMYEMDVEIVK